MTNTLVDNLFNKDLGKFFVGFDDTFDRITAFQKDAVKTALNYPPYNVKKVSDTKYVIELAIAGFGKHELDLELDNSVLTVSGRTSAEASDDQYIHKGISDRAFARKFTLADSVEIQNAQYLNGMLKIFLERIVPEEKKAKKIKIQDEAGTSEPQFLAETVKEKTK